MSEKEGAAAGVHGGHGSAPRPRHLTAEGARRMSSDDEEHAVFDGTSLPVEHGELMFTGPDDDDDDSVESGAAAQKGGSGGEGDMEMGRVVSKEGRGAGGAVVAAQEPITAFPAHEEGRGDSHGHHHHGFLWGLKKFWRKLHADPKVKPMPIPSYRHSLYSFMQATISIGILAWIDQVCVTDTRDLSFILASFGASAVLVHSAIGSPLAQPRNLVLGHVVSAFSGVTIYKITDNSDFYSAGLAVGLAIFLMERCNCVHPPGGATALLGVIGSKRLHDLGYMFVLIPALCGPCVMLLVGLLINNMEPTRKYPLVWDLSIPGLKFAKELLSDCVGHRGGEGHKNKPRENGVIVNGEGAKKGGAAGGRL